jgi:hypothetical protein
LLSILLACSDTIGHGTLMGAVHLSTTFLRNVIQFLSVHIIAKL